MIKNQMQKNKYIYILTILIILTIVIVSVFSGRLILPQGFEIGEFTIRYYGICMALAVLFAYALARKRASQFGLSSKQADDIIFYLIIGGFVGARVYHVLTSLGYYSGHPVQILYFWQGGLSIYGAVLGGLVTLILFNKTYNLKLSTLNLLNWLTPSLVLGQILGRFGNFFNYELYGYPTTLPWKMFVPEYFRKPEFISFNYFHPLFLYEQIGNFILLLFLFRLEKNQVNKTNTYLFFHYLLWYNLLRFGLEFLRVDSVILNGFRFNASFSLVLSLLSFVILYFKCRKTIS